MFYKLRTKFIVVSMLSVALVLGILIAGINIANYKSTVDNADQILKILSDNEGRFPERPPEFNPPKGKDEGEKPQRSLELAFESRYFSVLLDKDGNPLSTDTGMIAAVSSDEAKRYAAEAFIGTKDRGFKDDYRFLKAREGQNIRIIFYDCGRGLDSFRSFLKASVLISLAGMTVVFALIFFSSARVVRPVAQSYEKQKRFITDAGHEIKTPLAIINADADVILEEEDNAWAEDIKDQVKRLTELTESLILLAKMEEGLLENTFEDVDLTGLVRTSCESFSSVFITGNKELELDLKEGVHVKGDRKALKELMLILLDNAAKYSPEGGKTTVKLMKTTKSTVLEVSNDTVNNIGRKEAENLFERFYRTDKSRNSDTGGYGIGLSIAKAIAEAHKSRIYAVSEGDNTLKISLVLPEG